MAKSRCVSWSTATMMLLLLGSSYAAVELSDILAELQHERDSSLDGVIHVSEDSFKRFSAGKQRPYSLIVFLTARQVLDNPQLAMESLRKEYGLAAAAARSGPEPDMFFFLEAVFEESPRVFQLVNANQVPFIWRIAPNKKVNLNSEFPLDDHDKMTFQSVGSRHKYPWKAEDMIAYFGKTGLVAAEVNRPSILKSPWLPFLVVAFGVGLVLLAYLVWRLRLLHHPLPWAVGAILVFWFSVSGGMYNIIRGMPMFIRDKQGKIQFFLGGRGAQLGAEGFIVGSGYVLFSAAISLVTFAVPRVKNNTTRNVLSYVLVTAAAYMALKLFGVFVTKTGYHVSTYLMR